MSSNMVQGLGSDPKDTKGRRALVRALKTVSQGDMGRKIGVAQAVISQWSRGIRRPGPMWRRQLARYYGIAEVEWMTREEYLGERAAG